MNVIKQDIGERSTIYEIFGRDDRRVLVTVEQLSGYPPSITAVISRNGMSTRDAAEYAQALLTGIEIVNAIQDRVDLVSIAESNHD